MEELEVIITNDSLMAEDFYQSKYVILTIKKEELEMISNIVLRNGAEVLIRNTK